MERVCSADDRIIAALDVDSFEKMESIVEELGELVSFYKVGMELYYAEGSKTVEWLHEKGKQVFLDLKMYDIPNRGPWNFCRVGAGDRPDHDPRRRRSEHDGSRGASCR